MKIKGAMKNIYQIFLTFFLLAVNLFSIDTAQHYTEAKDNRLEFWAKQAQCLDWFKPWDRILEWNPPYAKWFSVGKLNACFNGLDRHMNTNIRHKTAIFWEGEKGATISLSYEELYQLVNKFSNIS